MPVKHLHCYDSLSRPIVPEAETQTCEFEMCLKQTYLLTYWWTFGLEVTSTNVLTMSRVSTEMGNSSRVYCLGSIPG